LKKISFVNPNFQTGPKELNAYYLPYASGLLWCYLSTFKNIESKYTLGEFIWRRNPIDQAVEQLKDSSVVGFSTYIWNKNYNYQLAKKLKTANPEILVVFGGPEVAHTDPKFFQKYPYIDVCVKQEGEVAFKRILETNDFTQIPGLIVNQNGRTIDTGPNERINELDQIPSPYLTNLFAPLIAANPDVTWNAILETNRGCPYHCTFCDWGSLTYSKVKKFDISRVLHELEWCGKNSIDFVIFADANFGIFTERDSIIADKLIEVQQTYNNPKVYSLSWNKNQKKETVDIIKKLVNNGKSRIGLNLSVQTLNDDVLRIIKRDNLPMNAVEEIFETCEANGIPLYTELILGLPGETLESWRENFYKLYRAGNHTGISVYQAELLENAEMNLLQKKLYKLKGTTVYDYLEGSYNEDEVKESMQLVASTATMPKETMLDAQVFSWYMTTFHINGLTNYVSRFLYKHLGIDYQEFYDKLFVCLKNDYWFKQEISQIRNHYNDWLTRGQLNYEPIQGMQIHGWNLINSTVMKLRNESKLTDTFDLIGQFVEQTFNLDPVQVQELVKFQRHYLVDYSEIDQFPKELIFNYDFLGYLHSDSKLTVPATYRYDYLEDTTMSFQQFCEQIFFSRRKNFGKAWISRIN
jgi:radical SAM superfamily enzyme YgiQ (UPF0313 family)